MPEATLERTVRFRAHHHYRRADWSEVGNREAFGAVAEPHSHDYVVTVTVKGELDAHGFMVHLPALDAAMAGVIGPLEGGDLNRLVFDDGCVQPTTEALARWLWERLGPAIPVPARLARVRVAESSALAAEYGG
jgi:6-pyruvoyltetrahydropterin/6-carboxytetrahydropterin synthase